MGSYFLPIPHGLGDEVLALLPADGDAHLIAPLPHAGVGDAVDGAVFPFGGGGGERGGVVAEEVEAVAVGAVHLDFRSGIAKQVLIVVLAPVPRRTFG